MSRLYSSLDEVPSDVLVDRLRHFIKCLRQGNIDRLTRMSAPPEYDEDADLVLFAAASRIRTLETKLKAVSDELDSLKLREPKVEPVKQECQHDWVPESMANNWREHCRKCGLKASGSCQ